MNKIYDKIIKKYGGLERACHKSWDGMSLTLKSDGEIYVYKGDYKRSYHHYCDDGFRSDYTGFETVAIYDPPTLEQKKMIVKAIIEDKKEDRRREERMKEERRRDEEEKRRKEEEEKRIKKEKKDREGRIPLKGEDLYEFQLDKVLEEFHVKMDDLWDGYVEDRDLYIVKGWKAGKEGSVTIEVIDYGDTFDVSVTGNHGLGVFGLGRLGLERVK